MRTFPIGRLFGIRLDLHVSWFIIYALVTLTVAEAPPVSAFGIPRSYAIAALAALVLFASVIAHELVHALTARRFGVRTRAITLFLFGGVATLESEPPSPMADAAIALAGPVASALLALAAFGAMRMAGALAVLHTVTLQTLLAYATIANGVLAAFNLVPAYPMDGGRVLRALLWRWRGDRDAATGGASLVGAGFACCFAGVGLAGIVLTRTWQFAWYVVIGAFLLRQCLVERRRPPSTPLTLRSG